MDPLLPVPSALESVPQDIEKLVGNLAREQEVTLLCDDYINGIQADPWAPDEYDNEYQELKQRAKTNLIRLPPLVASEVSTVEGYRRIVEYDADGNAVSERFPEEFKDFRRLRFGSLQQVVHTASANYGQAFVAVYKDKQGLPGAEILSSTKTTALWDNPVSDEFPRSVMTVIHGPSEAEDRRGLAYAWDAVKKYRLTTDDDGEWVVAESGEHGFSRTPVVRFPCFLDSEGRVSGMVENLIPAQDRVNQSVLDLLTGQAYTGNQIYTIAGVRGEQEFELDGTPKLDEQGRPVYKPFRMSARRVLTSDSETTKFDRIPAGSLQDLLAALGNSLEMFAVLGQQSAYIFHGKISNMSADSLAALDAQFFRLIEHLHTQWGEGWASLFRLFAEARGDQAGMNAWDVEVRWADYSIRTFAATADGLAKIADSLEIPSEGLWHMVPNVQSSTIEFWRELKAQQGDLGADLDDGEEGAEGFGRQVEFSFADREQEPDPDRDVYGEGL